MKVALVCIAKEEDNYIQEWIDYNKKLGFDDIIIYQNIDVNKITGLTIYNSEGKLFYSSDSYQENINISEFSKGLYQIEIKTAEKAYSQKLLIE